MPSQKFCLIPPCASVSSSGIWASELKHPQHIAVTGGIPTPPNILSSLPGRALGPLPPQIGHGRSPLHCRPSPWPGERGSHHSALLPCPESSLARDGQPRITVVLQAKETGSDHQVPSWKPRSLCWPPHPCPCLPNLPYLHAF